MGSRRRREAGRAFPRTSHDIHAEPQHPRQGRGPPVSAVLARIADDSTRHGASELERIDYLDGWRGLAILFVLQEHFLNIAGFDSGRLGVDIFFCLSGFLMSRILFVQRVPLATFYKRRISRILPVFLLFVLLVYGTALVTGRPGTWAEFLATLAFLRTYLPAEPGIWHTHLPVGHLWSLNVEEHCYVLLSLLTIVAAVRRRAGWLLMLLGAAAVAVQIYYDRHPGVAAADYEIRTETASAFLLVSAGYFLVRDRFVPLVRPWMPLAALALALPLYWHGFGGGIAEAAVPFLLAFAVNHLGQLAAVVRRALAVAPLRLLGIVSYSVYLWQQPFYQFRAQFPPGMALAGALLAGAASFYLFENPIRSWLNRHW